MKLRTLIDALKIPEGAEGLTAEQVMDLDVVLDVPHACNIVPDVIWIEKDGDGNCVLVVGTKPVK